MAERAALLDRVLLLAGLGVAMQVGLVLAVPTMIRSVPIMLGVLGVLGGLRWALQRGHVLGVAYLTIYGSGAVVLAYFLFGGGRELGYGPILGVVPVMGGIILGARTGLALTAVALAACVAVYAFGSSDALVLEGQDPDAIWLSLQLFGIGLLGALVSWAVSRLHRSLRDARDRGAALESALVELEDARSAAVRLVAAMAEPVWVTDLDLMVISANEAAHALIGEDPVGTPLGRWLALPTFDERRIRGQGELMARHGPLPVQVSRSPLRQKGSDAWLFVTTDLSRRVEAERRIREAAHAADEANRAKSHFLANMSHELRTPLNAIIGYSELLLEELPPEAHADVQRVHSAGTHLLSLINDVLDMSKIEAGKMDVVVEELRLADVVVEVLEALRPMADAQRNTLRAEVSPDLRLGSDRRKLTQILMNLVSNAVKYTADGAVWVRVARVGDTVRVEVEDTGRGISEEDQGRLFQPFRQLGEDAIVQPGTGLGLVLSQRLAALVGGEVSVSSRVGVGSTFTLTLPVSLERAA